MTISDSTVYASGTLANGNTSWAVLKNGTVVLYGGSLSKDSGLNGAIREWIDPSEVTSIVTRLGFNGDKVKFSGDCSELFKDYTKLKDFDLSAADLSGITNASGMFANDTSLATVNLTGFEMPAATDISSMFAGCTGLKSAVLPSNMKSVENAASAFSGDTALASVDASGITSANITDANKMFCGCTALTGVYMPKAGGKKDTAVNLNDMFSGDAVLTHADIENLIHYAGDTDKTTYTIDNMFNGCAAVMTIISGTGNYTSTAATFDGCTVLVSNNGNIMASEGHTDGKYATTYDEGYFQTADAGFDVYLNGNGGTVSAKNIHCYKKCPIGDILSTVTATRPGYQLKSWSTSDGPTGRDVDSSTAFMGATSIYAVWKPVTYNISFNANGGTGSISSMTGVKYGVITDLPFNNDQITRQGEQFSSWNTEPDGSGKAIVDGSKVLNLCNEDGDTAVLYAQWGDNDTESYDEADPDDDVQEVTLVDSGKWGGCRWTYTSDHVLSIYSGQGADPATQPYDITPAGWSKYASEIRRVDTFGTIEAPADCEYLFAGLTKCRKIDLSAFDTTKTENMSYMFYNCPSLQEVNLSSFNTAKVGSMAYMFSNCTALKKISLSSFNTAKVSNMEGMFCECTSLSGLNLSGFDTKNVVNMKKMFYDCVSMKSIDVSAFDTSKVKDMSSMFARCSLIQELDLSNFDTSAVTDMSHMFEKCTALQDINIYPGGTRGAQTTTTFKTDSVKNMNSMFRECVSKKKFDLADFDTSAVTDMGYMFYGCRNAKCFVLTSFNTATVTTMESMFEGCTTLNFIDLSSFTNTNTSNMKGMFKGDERLIYVDMQNASPTTVTDITKNGKTQKAVSIEDMFNGCSTIQTIDISKMFDGGVTFDLNNTFSNCQSLTTIFASDCKAHVEFYEGSCDAFTGDGALTGAIAEDGKAYIAYADIRDDKTHKDAVTNVSSANHANTSTETSDTGEEGKAGYFTPADQKVTLTYHKASLLDDSADMGDGVLLIQKQAGKKHSKAWGVLMTPFGFVDKYDNKWQYIPEGKTSPSTFSPENNAVESDIDLYIPSPIVKQEYPYTVNDGAGNMTSDKYSFAQAPVLLEGPDGTVGEDDSHYSKVIRMPAREDKVFVGFTYSGMSDEETLPKTLLINKYSFTDTDSVSYQAVWTEKGKTVTLDANGGVVAQTTISGYNDDNSAVGSLPTPSREGFTFAGWFTKNGNIDSNNDGIADGDWGDEAKASMQVTSDMTLYAKWEAAVYNINYVLDGGSWGTETVTKTADDGTETEETVEKENPNPAIYTAEDSFTLADPVREGYDFAGWTGTGLSQVADPVTIWSGSTGNRTYKAHWSKPAANTVKILFDTQGGEMSVAAQRGKIGETWGALPRPEKSGYVFSGWYSVKDGESTDGARKLSAADTIASGDDGTTYYAHWTEEAYTIRYDGNGADAGSGVGMGQVKAKSGEQVTLTENTFTKDGCRFIGWATSPKALTANYADMDVVCNIAQSGQTAVLYAVWQTINDDTTKTGTFTVSFDGNGGTGSMDDKVYTEGSRAKLPKNKFTKTGYTFAGWAVSQKAETAQYADEDESSSFGRAGEAVTLYAVWKAEAEAKAQNYTIRYNANGGVGTMADETIGITERKQLTANAFTKDGFTFAGWSTSPKAQIVKYEDAEYVSGLGLDGQTVNLYAVWKSNTGTDDTKSETQTGDYTIHFNANGGTGSISDMTVEHGTQFMLPKVENTDEDGNTTYLIQNNTSSGIAFTGWAKTPDATGAQFSDGATVKDIYDDDGDGEVTLYAVWKTGVYTVKVPTIININNVNQGEVDTDSEPYDIAVQSYAPDSMLGTKVSVEMKKVDLKSTNPANKLTLTAKSTDDPLDYVKTDTKQDQLNVKGEVKTADTWKGTITYLITEDDTAASSGT